MKLAIMQPYFFPYPGYFQLISSVDKFIILDDVNFIKRGWINRNRICVNGEEFVFTVPVKKVSQNRKINELELANEIIWREKHLKTIELAYRKARAFSQFFPLVSQCFNSMEQNLSRFVTASIRTVAAFLSIDTTIIDSSRQYETGDLKGVTRLLEICRQERADEYVNAIGGRELYDKASFTDYGINLTFLQPAVKPYEQFSDQFIPNLSIIDLLMHTGQAEAVDMMNSYLLT